MATMNKKKPEQTFGARLYRIRMKAGMTQTGLAGRAGIAQRAVAEIEAGKYEPGGRVLLSLAAALGVDPVGFYA